MEAFTIDSSEYTCNPQCPCCGCDFMYIYGKSPSFFPVTCMTCTGSDIAGAKQPTFPIFR